MNISIGEHYYSAYTKTPVLVVNIIDDTVYYWYNPGWIGNWFWAIPKSKFESTFTDKKIDQKIKKGGVPGAVKVGIKVADPTGTVQIDHNNLVKRA